MVVLMVALIVMSIVYGISISLFEKDARQKNALILDYVKETLDGMLSEINKLGFELSYNESLLNLSKNQQNYDLKDAVQLTSNLRVLKSTNKIINEISIYFPKSGQVINSTGRFTAYQFYLLYHRQSRQNYDEYLNMLNRTHVMEYVVHEEKLNNKEEFNINFYHTLSIGADEDSTPVMIILLDRKKIEHMIELVVRTNSEYFAIMHDRTNIIADSGNKSLLTEAMKTIHSEQGMPSGKQWSNALMISQTPSLYGGLYYVSISKKSYLLGVLDTCRNILIIGILFILVFDMAIAVFFSKLNAKPISNITMAISQKVQFTEKDKDVYEYLENNIKNILNENATISKTLENQMSVLKNYYAIQLLQGNMIEFTEYQQFCNQYHIDTSRGHHCIFALYVQSVQVQIEKSGAGMDDIGDALYTLLSTSVKKLCTEDYSAELVKLDAIYCVWITVSGEDNELAEKVEKYCNTLIDEVRTQYGITIKIACGNIYDNWNQIALSYTEALQALDGLIKMKDAEYLNYASLKKDSQYSKSNSLELLSQFVNCLKLQDYENALRMTDSLFMTYLHPQLTKDIFKLHRNTLVSIIMDTVEQASAMYGQLDYCQCYHRIQSALQKPSLLQQVIKETIQEIIDCQCKNEQLEYSRYTKMLKEYIDQNYADPNLGLYMIADHFGMNNTYLSKIFKNEFNIGVLEYINKVRIEKAKQILIDTDQSILQVSQAVGYLSDITFIRVFKRYEGTTPGRFREGMKRKQVCC